ncbi:MAG: hypothetical protein AABP62_19010 [Planctomycetota bacterium]
MRIAVSLSMLFVIALSGCAHTRLSCNSPKQARTLTEIEEQQVLDNIAMFAVNCGSTPYFALPNGGATQTQHSATLSGTLFWSPHTLLNETGNANGTLALTENWTLKPINEPERLQLMKCVYQHVTQTSCSADGCQDCCTQLINFFGPDFAACDVPSCWFSVCHKKPRSLRKGCCVKVGHYCGTYVCVEPEYFEYLSRVTVSILDIATVDSLALASRLAGSPKTVQIEETFDVMDDQTKRTIKGTLRIPADVYAELKGASAGRNTKSFLDIDKGLTPTAPIESLRPRRESGSSFESLIQLNQNSR